MHIKWGQIPCRSSSDPHTTLGEESYSERIRKLSGVCKWGWQPQLYRSRGVKRLRHESYFYICRSTKGIQSIS